MNIVVTVLFVLTAILLIAVVLIQQPKTAGGLFSGTGQSLLGTSGKSFWTKFTTILAGFFMLLCLLMSFINRTPQSSSSVTDLIEKQQQAAQPITTGGAASSQMAPNPNAQAHPGAQTQGAPGTASSSTGSSQK